MFERRSLMLTRPRRSWLLYALAMLATGAGGLLLAYEASFSGPMEFGTGLEAQLFSSVLSPLPEFARALLWLLIGVFAVISLGWEALVMNGRRSNLEYEETHHGFDVYHHDWKPPFRAARRSVPRGANMGFSVTRAGRAAHGVVRKWNATITANGEEIAKVEVTAAIDSQLDRVSFAPLRDIAHSQGGVLHAMDPLAERLLGPPGWLVLPLR